MAETRSFMEKKNELYHAPSLLPGAALTYGRLRQSCELRYNSADKKEQLRINVYCGHI